MSKSIVKSMISAVIVVGSLGLGTAVIASAAGAATRPTHKPPAGVITASAIYKGLPI